MYNNFYRDTLEEEIAYICNNEYMNFLCKPNVVGVGVGYKIIGNFISFNKCITVFVRKKIPKDILANKYLIPKKYKDIITDVVESGEFHETELKKRIRPVIGGYSISNELFGEAGTFGCMVTDKDSNYYVLGNNHILALRNLAPLGSRIIQPALSDGGEAEEDTIAELSNFIELKYETETMLPDNFVDCAVAKLVSKATAKACIAFIGVPNGINDAKIGMEVKKCGKKTELTMGIIRNINVTVKLATISGRILYKNQIIADEFVRPGDSGSILVDNNNNAIGLLMSLSEKGLAAHNPIDTVLKNLNVELVTTKNLGSL